MKNKILVFLVFLTGISISSVAAWYSIIGLTAIFAGAFLPIVVMGSALEIGKLVTASWLYQNWRECPIFLKIYLCSALVILMIITSMGIFGFLSKAHIEQQITTGAGTAEQIQIVDNQIKIHGDSIAQMDRQLEQINAAIEKINQTNSGRASLVAVDGQRKNRDELIRRRQDEIRVQSDLKIQRIKLESENKRIEAEIGPIKYVAELIYGSSDTNIVDKAIRLVIVLLIIVFDPLAILLLIAFNISISQKDDYEMEYVEINSKKLKGKQKRKKNNVSSNQLPIEG